MGIVTVQRGDDDYVIASDCDPAKLPTTRAPKRMASPSHVWTGTVWSTVMTEAKIFVTPDDADEYLRSHYAKVTGQR
ncbi:MAG TPA: hypothetical protein VHY91_11140 [Pirellulales bacterium]|nr:hypothetical protein [Pirellulales bacterium]